MIDRLAIIGVGLIGGSLARALRQAGAVREVVGYGRRPGSLQEALALGVIDRVAPSAAAAVEGADMVVLAVPVGITGGLLAEIRDALAPDTVVTDVGSVKGSVVAAARAALGARFRAFVPGHPIAGTERSGVAASFAGLFQGQRAVLTPEPDTDRQAVARVRAMWQAAGARVVELPAADHDRILAASSHLPHLLAFVLMEGLARRQDQEAIFAFSAGGFRDFTRIAGSDPVMWRDIALANREALLEVLAGYRADLDALVQALQRADAAALEDVFRRARQAHRNYLTATHAKTDD